MRQSRKPSSSAERGFTTRHTHTHTPLIIPSLRLCVLADVPSGALGLQALFCLFYTAYSSLSTAAEDNRLSYSFDNYI